MYAHETKSPVGICLSHQAAAVAETAQRLGDRRFLDYDLRIASNERLARCARFGEGAREFDAAHASISRVRTIRRARDAEGWIENIFSMFPPAQTIVDDESKNDIARARFAVGNILAPEPAPHLP